MAASSPCSKSSLALLRENYESDEDGGENASDETAKALPPPDLVSPKSECVRSFPHVKGAWPTFVCIQVLCNDVLEDLKFGAVEHLKAHGKDDAHRIVGNLHVTLSRTVTFVFEQIQPFLAKLRESLADIKPFLMHIKGDYSAYTNDEGTRSFAGIRASASNNALLAVTRRVDAAMAAFKKPPYYTRPDFHVSMAWCLGRRTNNENTTRGKRKRKADADMHFSTAVDRVAIMMRQQDAPSKLLHVNIEEIKL